MPNRLVRDGLVESERVLALPVEGRWLFVVMMLSGDDVGLFEATTFRLARRADLGKGLAEKLMQLMGDADLVRFFEVDGKRYGFIPRFRQRIQIKRARHPLPPDALLVDDDDALSKIKHLRSGPTVVQPLDNGCAADGQPSEPEPEPEELQVSVATQPRRRRKADDATAACPYREIVERYHARLPTLPQVKLMPRRRQEALLKAWRWVLSSTKLDGARRATTADEALRWFDSYFARASRNDFLMGRTRGSDEHANWRCDLHFLLTDRGRKHVIEHTEVTE